MSAQMNEYHEMFCPYLFHSLVNSTTADFRRRLLVLGCEQTNAVPEGPSAGPLLPFLLLSWVHLPSGQVGERRPFSAM